MKIIRKNKGQTALILVLLAAAALIFYAITLNWGRIAQEKTMVTIAADSSAAMLGSLVASYGEAQKVQYLENRNQNSKLDLRTIALGIVAAVAIVLATISIVASWSTPVIVALVTAAAAGSTATTLQPVVVNPIMMSAFNKLQQNQPPPQQFLESTIGQALQMTVTDPATLSDYFDSNANGLFMSGQTGAIPIGRAADTIGRFAFFYTERLKMFEATIPFIDPQVNSFKSAIQSMVNPTTGPLTRPCSSRNTYCNPCCQPYFVPSLGARQNPYVHAWPRSSCPAFSTTTCQSGPNIGQAHPGSCNICACESLSTPIGTGTGCNPYDESCAADVALGQPMCEGLPNNPYSSYGTYPFLYDATFQTNYPAWPPTTTSLANDTAILQQWGKDLQYFPGASSAPNAPSLNAPNPADPYAPFVPASDPSQLFANPAQTPLAVRTVASFPNGIYPFFWYSQYNASNQPQNIPNNTYATDAEGSYDDPALGADVFQFTRGDNEMCSQVYPYNRMTVNGRIVACNPNPDQIETARTLRTVRSTLEDFLKLGNIIQRDRDTIYTSANLTTWYPQVSQWIAPVCDDRSPLISTTSAVSQACRTLNQGPGKLLWIWNPYVNPPTPESDLMSTWQNEIVRWLRQPSTNSTSWCFPPNGSTYVFPGSPEYTYIDGYGRSYDAALPAPFSQTSGNDLGHVLACLDYNGNITPNAPAATSALAAFQACRNDLPAGACPSRLPLSCRNLNRSLVPGQPRAPGGYSCNPNSDYMRWLNGSIDRATNAAPQFQNRAAFLKSLYNEAAIMLQLFTRTRTMLWNLLGNTTDVTRSPAYQLMEAETAMLSRGTTSRIPNSAIYGWQDPPPLEGTGAGCGPSDAARGCGHMVEVTAYSAGRIAPSIRTCPENQENGGDISATRANSQCMAAKLPWIYSHQVGLEIHNDLTDRDGWVFVRVKRWDESRSTPTKFANQLPLWNFSTRNPASGPPRYTWENIQTACFTDSRLSFADSGACPNSSCMGYGLTRQMIDALKNYASLPGTAGPITPNDREVLSRAFMLNDSSDAFLDPNARGGGYTNCLTAATTLLGTGISSEACVAYIATDKATGLGAASPLNDQENAANYTVVFEQCPLSSEVLRDDI